MKTHPVLRPASSRVRAGFTLIELLTVIAIIGVLAAIIFPVVGRVRESAKSSACSSNLRQVGIAIQGYITDNKGALPPSTPWLSPRFNADPRYFQAALLPYLSQAKTSYWGTSSDQMTYSPMFDCPGYKGDSVTAARYALNKTGTADDGSSIKPWGNDLYQDPKTGKFMTPAPTKYAGIPSRNKAITDVAATATVPANHSGHQNALLFDWSVVRVAIN